ncbi:RDD family protein [Pelovirga terrestris]|uniref:RDD family protein n=1 Tax=Pelovirga terrestris TaxID=2771352 RepID=A0A8J6QLH1_9BACT|nr:RDD family protein [Pelovirga terrestris]MBD1400534.1 RDD family protein [Pelovirga terrestris]
MKCPKCGYNSFDYLDSCKKCGKDLVEFKQRFGIKSVLFPGAGAVVATDPAQDSDEASELAAATALGAADASAAAKVTEPADDSAAGDDFGFDFMGESSEEEDLSFDELFEEAPQDDDMEESLDAPKNAAATEAAEVQENDFAFDMPEADDDLEDDFGFDAEDVEAPDTEPEKPKGSAEGPSDPFDLPESSPVVGAPVTTIPAQASTTGAAAVASSVVEQRWADDQEPAEQELSSEPAAAEISSDALNVGQDQLRAVAEEAPAEADNEGTVPVEPASLGGRFASFVYDAVILLVIGLGFVVAAELSMSRETGPLPTMDTLIDLSVPYFLILFSLTFGYFTLFHFLAGQTPGKMLTSLQVETCDGEPLTFSQAFLRSVGGLLQLLPFALGYLQLLFSGDGRGWNDQLAGTRVVKVPPKQ